MIKSIKENLGLLKRSGRNIIKFELAYKMAAIAIVIPLLVLILDLGMRIANIRYLTNGYIIKALTNPFVIMLFIIIINLFLKIL